MVLAVLYLLTATCYVQSREEERRYYGVCQVNANQTRQTATARRLSYHKSHPVAWVKHALPDTMGISPLGHCMSMQSALVEEAIRTARAFVDGGDAVRGGPWCGPHVGSVGRSEMGAVRRIAERAVDGAEARAGVLAHAAGLSESSGLRKHCENLRFGRDTAPFGPARKARWSKRRKYPSGCEKRKSAGMTPGNWPWEDHKWGSSKLTVPETTRSKAPSARGDSECAQWCRRHKHVHICVVCHNVLPTPKHVTSCPFVPQTSLAQNA